jgi:hypothetical protein
MSGGLDDGLHFRWQHPLPCRAAVHHLAMMGCQALSSGLEALVFNFGLDGSPEGVLREPLASMT